MDRFFTRLHGFRGLCRTYNPHPSPHLAFEVDDLEVAVATKQLTGAVTSPSNGVPVAVLVEDGVPIEVL